MTLPQKLAVTVLSGLFGTGQTTLFNHVMNNCAGKRVAAIVNGMGEVSIPAELIHQRGAGLWRTQETILEMSYGYICCTLHDDLLEEASRLASEERFDYLLIGSTGISEPHPVAAAFDFRNESGFSPGAWAKFDAVITVVDAAKLLNDYSGSDFLADRGGSLGPGDQRPLVQLLVDQIEFTDVIVLSNVSELAPHDLAAVRRLVHSLNPDARIVEADFARVEDHPQWAEELFDFASQAPETEEYGVESFGYRSRRSFHPDKFHAFLNATWPNVVRAKDFFWIATRSGGIGEVSPAGARLRHQRMGRWWASAPDERWQDSQELSDYLERNWDPWSGDRRQEIVSIDIGPDAAAVTARLDTCLTGPGPGSIARSIRPRADLTDPFPASGRPS